MTTWKRKQGDVRDTARVGLKGIASITGATAIIGHVKLDGDATINLDSGSIIKDVADSLGPCAVSIPLGAVGGWLSTATPGPWLFEVEISFPDGTVLTWPAEGYDTIIITEDLA